jgi:retron-type reverse transcriptase
MNRDTSKVATVARRRAWHAAKDEFIRRAGSANYLFGTFMDRQTGAVNPHHLRRRLGVHESARKDGAGIWTAGVDGMTREQAWVEVAQAGPKAFIAVANRVAGWSYIPQAFLTTTVDAGGGKVRNICVPTTLDRTVLSVLLEVLEPLIDPILSESQHGYRATRLAGHRVVVRRHQGFARGSTQVVGLRLKEAVCSGYRHVAEADIVRAFPSVSRPLLREFLVADGCSRSFARYLGRCLGNKQISRTVKGTPARITGIPLGNPVGPLLFNFFARTLHDLDLGDLVLVSYADNFFLAARTEEDLGEALKSFETVLKDDLLLNLKVKQRWSPDSPEPLSVLQGKKGGGWRIVVGTEGRVRLEPPRKVISSPSSTTAGKPRHRKTGGRP